MSVGSVRNHSAAKPFAVLRYLVENPVASLHIMTVGCSLARDHVQPQVLRTYMLELRKILGDRRGTTSLHSDAAQASYVLSLR